jgi:tetratricopeptide (TPR) repeat protein
LCLLGGGVALAQPAAPTPAEKAKAGELVKEAIAKSQAGDHAGAIDLYRSAYKIVPLPLLLSNIGAEYKASDKPALALDYFCQYLKADPAGTNVSYATSEARALQTALKNPNAEKDVCAPLPPPPPPVDLNAGVDKSKIVDPVPLPPPPPPARPGKPLEIAGAAVGVVGLVGLGVGIYFGSQASKISDDITNHDPNAPWPDDIKAQESKGQSDENKQIAFMAIGGAAVAAGVVLYLVGHGKNTHAEEHAPLVQLSIAPVASPDHTGFALLGRF